VLLHLFARPSCRGAVGHGWMVHEHCVSPDLYALMRLRYLTRCLKEMMSS
jgi:hypothetical protein